MKLKDNVTKEQLEELGFYTTYFGSNHMKCDIVYGYEPSCILIISLDTKDLILSIDEDYGVYEFGMNDTLLKMFQLGYIEESELE